MVHRRRKFPCNTQGRHTSLFRCFNRNNLNYIYPTAAQICASNSITTSVNERHICMEISLFIELSRFFIHTKLCEKLHHNLCKRITYVLLNVDLVKSYVCPVPNTCVKCHRTCVYLFHILDVTSTLPTLIHWTLISALHLNLSKCTSTVIALPLRAMEDVLLYWPPVIQR